MNDMNEIITALNELETAHEAGRQAAIKQQYSFSNPYPVDSANFAAWHAGFREVVAAAIANVNPRNRWSY
jgi:hypothetical protein